MSGFALATGIASGLETILIQPSRAIQAQTSLTPTDSFSASIFGDDPNTIIPDCALEERGLDRVIITQHPVERGAAVADHVYKVPAEVTLRWGWTNSPSLLTNGQLFSIRGPGFVQQVYEQLLEVQTSGFPFNLFTGKRAYQNMMMSSLMVTTDGSTENVLMCTAICTEVIIVDTQVTQQAPQSAQANPSETSPTANNGTQTPKPAPLAPNPAAPSSPGNLGNAGVSDNFLTPDTTTPISPFSPSGFPLSELGAIPF